MALLVFALGAPLIGESKHAIESMRKQERAGVAADMLRAGYLQRAGSAARRVLPIWLIALLGGVAAAFLADASNVASRVAAFACASVSLLLWTAFELGPPFEENGKPRPAIRGRLLNLVKLESSPRAQYTQLQRGLMDLALLGPPLIGAAVAAQTQERPAVLVLAWAVLVIPVSRPGYSQTRAAARGDV